MKVNFKILIKNMFFFASVVFLSIIFAGCSVFNKSASDYENSQKKLTIVTTIFPLYDFTKQIVKDKAEVKMLLPPGVDEHNFEANATQIAMAINADLFFFTGTDCEPWVSNFFDTTKNKKNNVVDITKNVKFIKVNDYAGGVDPHIWLDLDNCVALVENICDALCKKDPANEDFYKKNSEEYKKKLLDLDSRFQDVIKKGRVKKIAFASKFAGNYFVSKYGLDFIAAYNNCEENAEPDAKRIVEIINFVKNNNISAVFYEGPSTSNVASTVSSQTNAKILKFNTLHTIDKTKFENGVSFLNEMQENLKNIEQGVS